MVHETHRKIILPAGTLLIIFTTTFFFHQTQSHYKNFALGKRLFLGGQYEKSLPYLASAYRTKPHDLETAEYLLWNYQKLRRAADAQAILEALWKEHPDDLSIPEQLGDHYYDRKDYSKAEELYRRVLERKPNLDTQEKLAEVLAWQKKYDEALFHLNSISKEKSTDPKLIEFMADVHAWAKQYEKAAALYKSLLPLPGDRKKIVLKLADVLRYMGRDQEAIGLYKEYMGQERSQ